MTEESTGRQIDAFLLGRLEVCADGVAVPLGGPQQRALLARLLLSANEVVSVDRLVDDLWGESAPRTAEHTLHVYVGRLRKLLGGELIATRPPGYAIELDPESLDVVRFRRLLADGEEALRRGDAAAASAILDDALGLWRGTPLADLADERFAQPTVRRLEEDRQRALEARFEADLALGRHTKLVPELQGAVRDQPFRERLHGYLMLALYRSGRQAEALDAYRRARALLVDELGMEPGRELQALEQAILRHDASLEPPTLEAFEPRLPAAPNRFVGRDESLAALERLLLGDARLVTVTGPGGAGKTRLALEAAARLAPGFGGLVTFVPLAGVAADDLLGAAIAQALELKETGEPPLDTVKVALRSSRNLLVLDNFEHLLGAAMVVSELLAACPPLRVVVTSRAPLHLSAEYEYEVPPLAPGESLELFVERAVATSSRFSLTKENERTVAAICDRLDGLPLALELAAARSKTLSPETLLERLESRLGLLTSGPRDVPPRQQTLRATIDWSYRLLTPEERRLFARLAVFAGSFTLEGLEAIVDVEAVDGLGLLIDNSLVRRAAEPGRFSMLETIREFARERLAESGEAEALRRRHAGFYVDLAERCEAERGAADHADWDARLEADHDEFRAALAWLAEAGEAGLELRLATALAPFWRSHGYLSEGSRYLARALSAAVHDDPELLVRALSAAAGFAYFQGRYDDARRLVEDALELARVRGDRTLEGRLLVELALILSAEDDLERAQTLLEDAVVLFRSVDNTPYLAATVHNLGYLVLRRDELERAGPLFAESLELFRTLGDDQGIAVSLHGRGMAALFADDAEGALAHFRESLDVSEAQRFSIGIAAGLEGIAAALALRGDARTAATLLGSADLARETEGVVPEPLELRIREAALEACVAALGSAATEELRARGRSLSLAEAIAAGVGG